MDMATVLQKIGGSVPESLAQASWMRPRYPLMGVELREDAVVVTRLQRRKGQTHLAGHGRKALAEGVFRPTLSEPPVGDARALVDGIHDAMRLAGAEATNRISLAVPDTMARTFLVDVQGLPSSKAQADEVIRWRIKKSIPFGPEDSRLSWQPLGQFEDGKTHVLVAVAPESGIRSVERLLEESGLRVGLVDLASLNVLNTLRLAGQLEGPADRDVAILDATPGYFSVIILRGERMIFYRSKAYHVQGGFRGEESLRVVGRELRTTLSYYEEHLLGEGIAEVLVRASDVDAEGFVRTALEAGCSEAALPTIGKLMTEVQGLSDETASELMPSLGLALRRMP